jgi:glutaconyl-CoA/methylmalonyl-CoA decarboxylase subunit gamma
MKKFKFTISGNSYEVEVKEFEENTVVVEVNGTNYQVEVHRELKKTKTPTLVRTEVKPEGKENIEKKDRGATSPVAAPLPGTIMEVYVKPGDVVKKGQKLLMMEAMKMENHVLSEKDGVVETIKVAAGSTVLQGDVLLELV